MQSDLLLTTAGGNDLNSHVARAKGVWRGGVVVAPVKSQPNRGVAPMAKAVEDKVAAIMEFVTDFEGMVSTWYVFEGGFETALGAQDLGGRILGTRALGGRAPVRHLEMMRNRGAWR